MMPSDSAKSRLVVHSLLAVVLLGALWHFGARPSVRAQDPEPAPATPDPAAAPSGDPDKPIPTPAPPPKKDSEIHLLALLISGGNFMIPLAGMSVIGLAFSIERFLGLRRSRVLPDELVEALGKLSGPQGGFDPRKAYRLCQQYPSVAANVIRAMLLKVGRPHSEVEHTVAEASEREAERMYANVRWLNLASSVSPLIGLLGTVWGMIICFHDTTNLPPGQNKADFLAAGIYVALVTTLGGLCVAIPASMLAHYFEGRITAMFHQIDELLFNLLPLVERFENRIRFSRTMEDGKEESSAVDAPVVAQ